MRLDDVLSEQNKQAGPEEKKALAAEVTEVTDAQVADDFGAAAEEVQEQRLEPYQAVPVNPVSDSASGSSMPLTEPVTELPRTKPSVTGRSVTEHLRTESSGLPNDLPTESRLPAPKPAPKPAHPPLRHEPPSIPSYSRPTSARDLALPWHYSSPVRPRLLNRTLWSELPTLNRALALVGTCCVALAFGRLTGPPVLAGIAQAYYPYTGAGKQELCSTHLRAVALALSAYAQDYDGRFPPVDYQSKQGQRATWVSLLRGRAKAEDLICPVGPPVPTASQGAASQVTAQGLVSSYALNPVLATAKGSEADAPTATLLLADGGTQHDLSLLPPYPSWPSFAARQTSGKVETADCNFDLRHNGDGLGPQAPIIYADGHAGILRSGDLVTQATLWGGSAVLRRARDRIGQSSPQARELLARLKAGNGAGAASYLKANLKTNRAALQSFSKDLVALWRLNSDESSSSDSVEQLGWQLAQAERQAEAQAGDKTMLAQLNEEQTRRCQGEVARVNSGNWEARQVDGRPTLRATVPALWRAESQSEGRYRRLFSRSTLASVFMLLEVGARSQSIPPQPINWSGAEAELKRRFGKAYRRLNLGSTLWAGQAASVWDYEMDKEGSPRLHKRLLGYTDGWNSYVISVSAPAKDWALWQPVFDKIYASSLVYVS